MGVVPVEERFARDSSGRPFLLDHPTINARKATCSLLLHVMD